MFKNLLHKPALRLFLVTLSFVVGFTPLATFTGDRYLAQDHYYRASILYRIAQITNIYKIDLATRQLIAANVSRERQIHSEETGPDQEQVISNKLNVMGVSTTIPVLMYHYIRVNPDPKDSVGYNLSVTPNNFDAQMNYLSTHGYHSISLDELAAILNGSSHLPTKTIVITLDDGYEDAFTQAYPILKKHGLKAADFIITGFVGGPTYLNWDQINEMKNSGVFSFGSHTITHRTVTSLNDKTLKNELDESKNILQSKLSLTINWFAYPYGVVDQRTSEAVKLAGFVGAFGTNKGSYLSTDRMFTLPRIRIGGSDSVSTLAGKLPKIN